MNRHIEYLLAADGKNGDDAVNDLLLVSLLIEMHVLPQKKNDAFYRQMLPSDLYEYEIGLNEYTEIKDKLLEILIYGKAELRGAAAGVLCETFDEEVFGILIEQLKLQYLGNPDVAVSIINGINGDVLKNEVNLLRKIYLSTDNENLSGVAKEKYDFWSR